MKVDIIRHSLAHILAYAVQGLYPGVKFGMGPAIENGFYYDFEFASPISKNDLPKIEKKMKELLKQNITFVKKEISKTESKKLFSKQPYKLELITERPDIGSRDALTVYESGKFVDLCKGPHVKSAREIRPDAFKLTKIAGAYWRGDEKNPMLTRIYGVAFENKTELEKYLKIQAEAEKRDHRLLGQKLELFMFDDEIGAGLPLWMPKGATLKKIIENYLYKELSLQGYQWVATPHIAKLDLWKTSGHWNLYRENMYSPIRIDEEEYMLKPMNCPFHVKIYNSKTRSYKNLPLRYAELGTVYRYEKSGVLHGLTRVRGFTQDDAHIVCAPGQLSEELAKLLKSGIKMLKDFGFKDFDIYLSTMPEKHAGDAKSWKKATNALKFVLDKLKLKYSLDSEGGVFYGPKIDIKVKDSLQRSWQCTTIQVDFNLPETFKMVYIDERGKKQTPNMIHRALLGSLERFIGVLLEHHGGNLPLWLSPSQIWIIPISDRHKKYAKQVEKELSSFRVEFRDENETISKKIREGEMQKIPYLLVVGDAEMKNKTVRVRQRGKGDIGEIKLNKFLEKIK